MHRDKNSQARTGTGKTKTVAAAAVVVSGIGDPKHVEAHRTWDTITGVLTLLMEASIRAVLNVPSFYFKMSEFLDT